MLLAAQLHVDLSLHSRGMLLVNAGGRHDVHLQQLESGRKGEACGICSERSAATMSGCKLQIAHRAVAFVKGVLAQACAEVVAMAAEQSQQLQRKDGVTGSSAAGFLRRNGEN